MFEWLKKLFGSKKDEGQEAPTAPSSEEQAAPEAAGEAMDDEASKEQ